MNKKIITSIIVLGIVLSLLNLQITQISSINNDKQIQGFVILDLVSDDPILITHDDNFTDYGLSGSGTAEEPYIIENYVIVTTNELGIYVNGTSKHFVIRNCYVDTTEYGIFISHVTEGTASVVNNTCMNNFHYGILVLFSSVATVANNTCTNNGYGIYLGYSSGATLTNNTCTNNSDGIFLGDSSGATLTNNTCTNNTWGIKLVNSDDCILTDNTCSNNKDDGIKLWYSNATLTDNTCSNSHRGIYLEHSGSTLTNNTCSNNTFGIELWYSNATLTDNTCGNNNLGIILLNSDDCILRDNICSNNDWSGIYLELSQCCILIDNTCSNNTHDGIKLRDSDSCLLTYNLLQENEEYGIYLCSNCDKNIIYHNYFIDNNLGGTSQGYDDGTNNIWHDTTTYEGNWWSDWTGTPTYSIDGSANAVDPFPLGEPLVPEFSNGINVLIFVIVLGVLIIPLSLITRRSKKQKTKKT